MTRREQRKMSSVFEEILQRKIQQTREESLLKGEADGLKKGRTEGRQEVARSMVADGSIPLSKIAEFSGLTLSEVENIRKSIHT